MKLGKHIIRKSSTIKKRLIDHPECINSLDFWKVLQIYECRIFGLCIYRDTHSEKELYNKILNKSLS